MGEESILRADQEDVGEFQPLGGVESDERKPGGVVLLILLALAVEGKFVEEILHTAALFRLVGRQGVEDFLRARFPVEGLFRRLAGIFEILEVASLGEVSIHDGVGVRARSEEVDASGCQVLRELADRRGGLA